MYLACYWYSFYRCHTNTIYHSPFIKPYPFLYFLQVTNTIFMNNFSKKICGAEKCSKSSQWNAKCVDVSFRRDFRNIYGWNKNKINWRRAGLVSSIWSFSRVISQKKKKTEITLCCTNINFIEMNLQLILYFIRYIIFLLKYILPYISYVIMYCPYFSI